MAEQRKYRGLTKEGKWVYGYFLVNSNNRVCIYDPEIGDIPIIPETVGQFTGLKDKKRTKEYPEGQEIYKGDTLKNPKDPRGNLLFDVAWSEMFHGWIGNSQTECLQMKPCVFDESEVIGNIHQPELMEQDNG